MLARLQAGVRILVTRVERPAHLAGDHIKTAQYAAWHIGLHVIRDASTDNHRRPGHRRGGGELIFRVLRLAKPRFKIHHAVIAEAFAEFAVIGVERNQARVDGIHQNATLAGGTRGKRRRRHRCGTRQGRLHDRFGRVEIRKAAAAVPDFRFGVDFTFPDLLTAVRFYRNYIVVRRAEIKRIADLQRRLLIFRAVAGRAVRNIAGVERPGDFQIFNVIAVNLIQRDEAAAARRIAVIRPVFLRVLFIDRF